MDISTLGSCIAIVMICYIVGMGCKASKRVSDEWIPVIMAVIGGILGAVGMGVSKILTLAVSEIENKLGMKNI